MDITGLLKVRHLFLCPFLKVNLFGLIIKSRNVFGF